MMEHQQIVEPSAPPVTAYDDLLAKLGDREWRLNNIYYITDSYGSVTRFCMNNAQRKLNNEMHYLNVILKARQLGFSTFILILALDCALFNSNFKAGLVADTLDNAQNLLKRVKFAYERLPAAIRDKKAILSSNLTNIEFSNGSSITVGTSLRSGTYNLVHVSEYGRICAVSPDKAKEVKSGALNTLAPKQLGFIESTAEGKEGDFYDKVQAALRIRDAGRGEEDMEYRLHFYPWYDNPKYEIESSYKLNTEDNQYFDKLRTEHDITLRIGQKQWYALKKLEQSDDMLKEHPSTIEEAFEGARDGAYFGKQIRSLRIMNRIGCIPFEPRSVVNTFWDMGVGDTTFIWLHQEINNRHRFVGCYENSGEGIAHYIEWLNRWATMNGAVFGNHYGPHDIEQKRMGEKVETIKSIAASLGFHFITVPRTNDKLNSIQNVRTKLVKCEFDEQSCSVGINHLENYCREWDERNGVWKSYPRHDAHSHGADGFMTFADGYRPPIKHKKSYKKRHVV